MIKVHLPSVIPMGSLCNSASHEDNSGCFVFKSITHKCSRDIFKASEIYIQILELHRGGVF